jgi:DNA-binding Lrp family transcriptional regulator
MDDMDRKILSLLVADGRRTFDDIGGAWRSAPRR